MEERRKKVEAQAPPFVALTWRLSIMDNLSSSDFLLDSSLFLSDKGFQFAEVKPFRVKILNYFIFFRFHKCYMQFDSISILKRSISLAKPFQNQIPSISFL